MQEVVFKKCLARAPLEPLKLEPVMPLLSFLHALPQESFADRALSPYEDETACSLLLCLPQPKDAPRLESLVEFFADPQYQPSRTLSVWYGIARAVARLIQDGD